MGGWIVCRVSGLLEPLDARHGVRNISSEFKCVGPFEMEWERWIESATGEAKFMRCIRPVGARAPDNNVALPVIDTDWERQVVEIQVTEKTYETWNEPNTGDNQGSDSDGMRTLVQFCGNDYLGLSMHPAVRNAVAKAAAASGMGVRASALVCGYTSYHRQLETGLAQLLKTEECLLCPTGFAANLAVMTALSINAPRYKGDRLAIFSDELNHASIIDGIRVAEKQHNSDFFVYRHNNMKHLEQLLSACQRERKVVITDSVFSMDGDYAPLDELVRLKEKYNFLLVLDEAHGPLVCGRNGGGLSETYGVEKEVDIFVGALSKAFGCEGGFIATSRKLKLLIQTHGRAVIFSTSLSIPVVAGAYAALLVSREEHWRRETLWKRVKLFSELTGLDIHSPIIPIIIGDASEALRASKQLLRAGFYVTAIRPPVVPANSSRLRITLSACHSEEHIASLCRALAPWLNARVNKKLSASRL